MRRTVHLRVDLLSFVLASLMFISLPARSGNGMGAAGLMVTLQPSEALPTLDRTGDIRAPDANDNGVRDDIEAWIAMLPVTQKQGKALLQFARSLQNTLMVDLNVKQALQAVAETGMAATKCLWHQLDDTKVARTYSQRIEA